MDGPGGTVRDETEDHPAFFRIRTVHPFFTLSSWYLPTVGFTKKEYFVQIRIHTSIVPRAMPSLSNRDSFGTAPPSHVVLSPW